MRVLQILTDGPGTASGDVLKLQTTEHEVEVIDLTSMDVSYEELVDKIFANDKVISW